MGKKEKTVKELRQEKREKAEREQAKLAIKETRAVDSSGQAATRKFSPLSISIIAISLAAVIGLSIMAGILISRAVNPYRDVDNPVAVISMSDGKELVFQLFLDEAPIAVTLFHYYAYHKYYNGTIIDAKTTKDFPDSLKLGRYTGSVVGWSDPLPRMFVTESEYSNGNFNFYMKDDKASNRQTNEVGALSTIRLPGGASAEFQICAAENEFGVGADPCWVFGWAYDDKTIANLRAYARTLETAIDSDNIVPAHEVRITKIKFFNDGELKKRVNCDTDFISTYLLTTRRTS